MGRSPGFRSFGGKSFMSGHSIGRRHALALAAGMLAAPAVLRHARAADRSIRLGFISPRTGPIAGFGEADPFVLGAVKDRLAEGVVIGNRRYPVEILARDSQSNGNRAAEVADGLIRGDKVDLLLASSTPETTNPVSDQAEVNGVPCITTDTPWEVWFHGRQGSVAHPFDWTYHFFWGQTDLSAAYTGMWDAIPTNRRVGTLWGNDPDGVALGDATRGLAPLYRKAGYEVVDLGLFPPMAGDFSAQIGDLKKAGVDIVSGVFIPPDFATFWTQCAQQGFRPKAVTAAKALLFPSAVEALGPRGAGLSSEVWWSPGHPFVSSLTGQSASAFCAAYTEATGRQWTQPLGFKHALIEVAFDVLRRTADIDHPEAIRDAIRGTDLRTLVGPVSWRQGPVPNVCTTPLVGGQWWPGTRFPYDLLVANNQPAPFIPVQKGFAPLPG